MNTNIITVESVTIAMKLRRLLLRSGIKSKLVKVVKNGCLHGVEIDRSDFYNAIIVMKDNGIVYSIYQ